MEKAYEIDKGIRINAEILYSNERERKWKRSLQELDKDLGDYDRPLKVGWSPPKRKKEPIIRLFSKFIP